MSEKSDLGALRQVPYMGVIHVVAEAVKLGFRNGHPDWANLGQGQPEVGDMEGAPPRTTEVSWQPEDQAYGPLEGIDELRESVAAHYNRLYRRGKTSQYGPRNVAVAQGGRLALTRAMAALGSVNVGYQLPDYTAYEDMFDLHLSRLSPIALRTREEDGFRLTPEAFERAVCEHDLSAFVFSNPCNPTGAVVKDEELERLLAVARGARLTLLLDEFYSHFVYDPSGPAGGAPVSAAAHVEDVDREPVLLVDGLTKSFRYPGWRLGWVVGPPPMVEAIARTASSLDGGPSRIVQRAALQVLEPARADQETAALRVVFGRKRQVMMERLSAMGVRFAGEPASDDPDERRPGRPASGTFYLWGCLEALRPPHDDAQRFFRAALERKVMTVPGEFFDVNPGKRRRGPSPYTQWMRFSFGPPMDNMLMGLDRLAEMVRG